MIIPVPWLRKSCGRTGTTTTTTFHRSPGWSPSPSRLTGRTRSSKSAVRIQLRSRHGNDNRSGRIRRSSSSTRVGHLRGLLPPLHPLSVHQHLTPSSRAEPSKPSFLPSFFSSRFSTAPYLLILLLLLLLLTRIIINQSTNPRRKIRNNGASPTPAIGAKESFTNSPSPLPLASSVGSEACEARIEQEYVGANGHG